VQNTALRLGGGFGTAGGRYYFGGASYPYDHGNELWVSDGTDAGTREVVDLLPGAANSTPDQFLDLNGILLFAAPVGMHSIWPWPLTPLTGRAIGAFLCGFGVAAAFALRENDLDRLYGSALAWATLGSLELLAVALHGDDLSASGPATALYVAFFASVLGVGAYGALLGRSA